jgi:hypothetical protein
MPPKRLGGSNSALYAEIGGLKKHAALNEEAKSLASRVRGLEVRGLRTAKDVKSLADALKKRVRSTSESSVKGGSAARERDLVRKVVAAYAASPKKQTRSPSKSPAMKKQCIDGARSLATARRGQRLVVSVRAAYNSIKNDYDWDGESDTESLSMFKTFSESFRGG